MSKITDALSQLQSAIDEYVAGVNATLSSIQAQLQQQPPVVPPTQPTPPATVDKPAGAIGPNDPIPATITANLYLARGGTYDVSAAAPTIKGGGIIIGAWGDPTLPMPVLKFRGEAFNVYAAPNLTIQDIRIYGAAIKDERFLNLIQNGTKLLRLDIGKMNSLIEQSRMVGNVLIQDCVQIEPILRYFAFIDGPNWTIKNNTVGPSIGDAAAGIALENIIRTSSPATTDCVIDGNTVTVNSKGAIDVRKGSRIKVVNNIYKGGPIRVGNDGDAPATELSSDVLVQGNKSLDGMEIRVVSGSARITVADNDAPVNISAPDKQDGRPGIDDLHIDSDRPVTVFGDFHDAKAFSNVTINAPRINQILGGDTTTIDPNAPAPVVYDVKIGESVAAKLKTAQASQMIRVEPGTVKESLTVPAGVTLDLTGCTIDGELKRVTGLYVDGTVVGGLVTNHASRLRSNESAVQVRKGGKLDGTEVSRNAGSGIGIPAGSDGAVVTAACKGKDNGLSNFCGTGSKNVQFAGVYSGANAGHSLNLTATTYTVYDDGTGKGVVSPGYELNKFTKMQDMRVDIDSTNNRGPALWTDADNRNIKISGRYGAGKTLKKAGTVPRDYAPIGLQIEMSGPVDIDADTTFLDGEGPALSIDESENVTVHGATFEAGAYAELRAMWETHPVKQSDGTTKAVSEPFRVSSTIEGGLRQYVLKVISIINCIFMGGSKVNEISTDGSIRKSLDYDKLADKSTIQTGGNVAK